MRLVRVIDGAKPWIKRLAFDAPGHSEWGCWGWRPWYDKAVGHSFGLKPDGVYLGDVWVGNIDTLLHTLCFYDDKMKVALDTLGVDDARSEVEVRQADEERTRVRRVR